MPIGDYCCQHMELSYHQASKYNQNPVWSLWSGLTKFTNFGHLRKNQDAANTEGYKG